MALDNHEHTINLLDQTKRPKNEKNYNEDKKGDIIIVAIKKNRRIEKHVPEHVFCSTLLFLHFHYHPTVMHLFTVTRPLSVSGTSGNS